MSLYSFYLKQTFFVIACFLSYEDLPSVRLVGNLPFNVSIPLLLQWLEAISHRTGPFTFGRVPMSLVFQKEVADVSSLLQIFHLNMCLHRLISWIFQNIAEKPGRSNCSRLSIMTQHLCEVKRQYRLPRTVFIPEPKVNISLNHLSKNPLCVQANCVFLCIS